MHPLHNSQPGLSPYNTSSLKHILFTFSLPSHSSSLPSSSTPPHPLLDDPRFLPPISFHLSTIPFPNAPPHKSKTSRRAAEGFQSKWLSDVVNFVEKNDRVNTWGFMECLNDKAGTRYFCDYVFRSHQGHHQKRYVGMDDREHELFSDWEKSCLCLVPKK